MIDLISRKYKRNSLTQPRCRLWNSSTTELLIHFTRIYLSSSQKWIVRRAWTESLKRLADATTCDIVNCFHYLVELRCRALDFVSLRGFSPYSFCHWRTLRQRPELSCPVRHRRHPLRCMCNRMRSQQKCMCKTNCEEADTTLVIAKEVDILL